jgi:hypothetical protein
MKIKLICLVTLLALMLCMIVSCGESVNGISECAIDENGNLVITYQDGSIKTVHGVAPEDGKNGAPGLSIIAADVNDNGEFVVTYSDGTEKNFGNVVGADGKDGAAGKDGANGKDGAAGKDGKDGVAGWDAKDGVGIVDIVVKNDVELWIQWSDGTEKKVGELPIVEPSVGGNFADAVSWTLEY